MGLPTTIAIFAIGGSWKGNVSHGRTFRVDSAQRPCHEARPMPKHSVTVNDKMQKGYRYVRSAPVGRNFDPDFKPQLTPARMLRLGVFGGKYMTDFRRGFPQSRVT